MRHVAVHILNLRQVLLRHVHQLRGAHLVGEPRKSLVERGRVVFLVVVLLRAEGEGKVEQEQKVDIERGERDRQGHKDRLDPKHKLFYENKSVN